MTASTLEKRQKQTTHDQHRHFVEPANDNSVVTGVTFPRTRRGSFFRDAPSCRIYRPAGSPMQSGKGGRGWLIEFEPSRPRWIEQLMGWTATDDPFAQIRMRFPTKEAAVDYAEGEGLEHRVIGPPERGRDAPR